MSFACAMFGCAPKADIQKAIARLQKVATNNRKTLGISTKCSRGACLKPIQIVISPK